MGNMSYCRFENTAADLRDYEVDALQDLLNHSLSIAAMKREIETAIDKWHEHDKKMQEEENEY